MNKSNLETWKDKIKLQPFVTSNEVSDLLDLVTNIVGRGKLLEWEIYAKEELHKTNDSIFPKVKFVSLGISVLFLLISLYFPITETRTPASNCFSLLIFAVSLWVSEALPYYTTALLICPLVVFMGVLRVITIIYLNFYIIVILIYFHNNEIGPNYI